jgi:plasmid stability protein
MKQLTLRIDDGLAARLKMVSAQAGRSVNAHASAILRAAVDPDLAGDEATRLRERMARAGLLMDPGEPRPRPPAVDVERARARAGQGRPLSDFVGEDRD